MAASQHTHKPPAAVITEASGKAAHGFSPQRWATQNKTWLLTASALLMVGVAWLARDRFDNKNKRTPGSANNNDPMNNDLVEKAAHEGRVLKGEASKDKNYTSQQTYPDPSSALQAFAWSQEKLMDVNAWSKLPGFSSEFTLHDPHGNPKTNTPQAGDFIRIVLPGPFPENWVQVSDVQVAEQSAEFTVHPSRDPREKGEPVQGEVEHFFGKEATSTFRVELRGNTLMAAEIGRIESINNQGHEAGNRAVINTLVAEGGWAVFQKMQWKKLTDYLVHLQ